MATISKTQRARSVTYRAIVKHNGVVGTAKLTTSDAKMSFEILMQQPRCSKIQMHAPERIVRKTPIQSIRER